MEIDLDSAVKGFFIPEIYEASFASKMRGRKELAPLIDKALSALYSLIGASEEDHMVFASSQAEAINHLLFSTYLDVTRKTGKNHFVTSVIDEAPQVMGMSRLQEMGTLFELAPANQHGQISVDSIRETVTPRTALVSLSMANGLTGVLQPIEDIAALCKERGILFHIDVSHTVGQKAISFKDGLCDFLTFSGESIGAPIGTALLFIRKDLHTSPFIIGGQDQGGLRGGNYNLGLLFPLAKAAKIAEHERDYFSIESARLRAFFETEVQRVVPQVNILFKKSPRVPHITAIDFPYVTGDALLYYLHRKKVFASQGGGSLQKISHILKASDLISHSALSFSLNRTTTEEELEKAAHIIEEGIRFLKKTNLSGAL